MIKIIVTIVIINKKKHLMIKKKGLVQKCVAQMIHLLLLSLPVTGNKTE